MKNKQPPFQITNKIIDDVAEISELARSARENLCLSAEIFRFFPWVPFQTDSNPL